VSIVRWVFGIMAALMLTLVALAPTCYGLLP
jgi:hypothetical protein